MTRTSARFTQHPLFPALLTVWFGATFGLCSLVVGQPTLESWVVATGLPEYLQAARPPLGSTARVLLALAACAVGSLVGLALAALLVREQSPAEDEALAAPLADDEAQPEAEPEPELEPEAEFEPHEPPVIAELDEDDTEIPSPDPMAPFFRNDAAPGHTPRAPFSVFDELGPDAGIAEFSHAEEEDAARPEPEPQIEVEPEPEFEVEPEVEIEAEPDSEPAPAFAGSPPLPSNVHAIGAARFAQGGLPPHFANDSAPEPAVEQPIDAQPVATPEQAEPPHSAPAPEEDDLAKLSYVQLTERLARAIAKNPQPPAALRRRPASEGASTAVASPGLERLRRVHARTAPANESAIPDADDIRDALSGLRNVGGPA